MSGKRKSKRRRRSKRERRQRQRWLSLGFAVLLTIAWIWLGPSLRELAGVAGDGPGPRGDSLRVVSWNLANFAGDASGHDLDRIREVVAELDPDVLALQEIKNPDALVELLPEFEVQVSDHGGRGHQRVAIAWRRDRVELLASREYEQLTLGGRVRPGLAGYLRGRDGPDFWLLVVHLKAMPDALELRRQQWPMLVEIADAIVEQPSVGEGDRDLLIMGDFNSTGPPGAGPAVEQRELGEVLAPAGLRRLTSATGCTAYYDGRRRDAWKEPSEIDLVWARELGESLAADAQVHSGTHCSASACRDFRSTAAYPNRDYESVSDHCPVVVDLARADDD